MNQAERRRFEDLQADRRTIEKAAAWLRQQAWAESYAGLHDKDRAFMLASLLDTLVSQLDRVDPSVRWEAARVDPSVRWEAARVARWLLGDRGT